MTRYRLRPVVSDWDGEDLWVGALPHGPILRVQGIGVLVLDLLASDPGNAPTPADLADRVREELDDVPEDAETDIAAFLAGLETGGILDVVRDDAP